MWTGTGSAKSAAGSRRAQRASEASRATAPTSAASSPAKAFLWNTSLPLCQTARRTPRGWFKRISGMAARTSTCEER
eukprot:5004990-Alexandrium_andersonii.AAC.1